MGLNQSRCSGHPPCATCGGQLKFPFVVLPCSHLACNDCRRKTTSNEYPECTNFNCIGAHPGSLISNIIGAHDMILSSNTKGKKQSRQCLEHDQELVFFCNACLRPICIVCSRSKTHDSHEIRPVHEVRKEMQSITRKVCEDVQSLVEEKQEQKRMIMEIQEDSKDMCKKARELISTRIARLTELLAQVEEKATNEVDEVEKDLAAKLQTQEIIVTKQVLGMASDVTELVLLQENHDDLAFIEKMQGPLPLRSTAFLEKVELPQLPMLLNHYQEPWLLAVCRNLRNILPDPEHITISTLKDKGLKVSANVFINLADEAGTSLETCLADQSFSVGLHYWEVEIRKHGWAVGISTGTGYLENKSVYAVGQYPGSCGLVCEPSGQLGAWLAGDALPLTFGAFTVLGLWIDCSGGSLSIHNSSTGEHLHTFNIENLGAQFRPAFSLYNQSSKGNQASIYLREIQH